MRRAITIMMSLGLAIAMLGGCGAPSETGSVDDMPSMMEDIDPRADGNPEQENRTEPAEGSVPEQNQGSTPNTSDAPSAQTPTEAKPQTPPAEGKPEQKPAETKPQTPEQKPQTPPAESKPEQKPAEPKPQAPEQAPQTPPAESKPEDAKPAENGGDTPSAAPTKADAAKYIGKSASSLRSALGAPKSTSYASSCLGDGEDGEWVYDGFTVYTYREGSTETVQDVD